MIITYPDDITKQAIIASIIEVTLRSNTFVNYELPRFSIEKSKEFTIALHESDNFDDYSFNALEFHQLIEKNLAF